MNNKPPVDNKKFLMRYAGLSSQLLAAIALGVFVGLKTDKWLHTSPLFTCLLPLLVLTATFYKLYKDTNRTTKK